VKYRGESEREAAYNLWVSAAFYAQKTLSMEDFVIPTVRIERHPFYVSYYSHLEGENNLSTSRTKSRLLQKRFVFDVQEVWLTNLEHLREHNPVHMYNDLPGDKGGSKSGAADETEDVQRGNGLKNRRDVRALESMDSQIQSVSQKRAFANAYHTSRLPNIQVVLDYEPRPTPELNNIKCLPPTIESLVRGLRLAPGVGSGGLPVLHSTALFPELVYVLHIDRLLPSGDYMRDGAMTEVMWRFSLFRNDDSSSVQFYLCKESAVTELSTQLILNKSEASQNMRREPSASYILCSGLVYAGSHQHPAHLSCVEARPDSQQLAATAREAMVVLSVAVLGMARGTKSSSLHGLAEESFDCVHRPDLLEQHRGDIYSIKLEICATVLGTTTAGRGVSAQQPPQQQEQKVFLECSPLELRYLLRRSPVAAEAPLGGGEGLDWWLSEQRAYDLWPLLAEHLALEGALSTASPTHEYDYALAFVSSAEQRQQRGTAGSGVARVHAEQVDGALSTLEALSCSFELLDAVRLVQQPNVPIDTPHSEFERIRPPVTSMPLHTLRLEGSPPSIFTHVELQQGEKNDAVEAVAAGANVFDSPYPPATPLLYFNDNVATTSRLPTGQKGAVSPSKGHKDENQHQKGKGRGFKASRVMAPVADAVRSQVQRGYWEEVEDTGSNLSMITSGALPTVLEVPGALEHGRKGIWFPDFNTAPLEFTQAAARFYREQRLTSSQSIFVNMTFALDTSLLFDPVIAWEDFSSFPAPSPAEEVDGVVPVLTAPPASLLAEALTSPLETRQSSTVMIFTSLPVEGVDFIPMDTPVMPRGFKRNVPTKNM